MTGDPVWLLVHGWGFGPEVWDGLAPLLPGRVVRWNLGHLGPPDRPALPDGRVIAVGHSYGAHWLLRRPRAWAGFVAINGFRRFPAPARLLDRMAARLHDDPAAVVTAFRARCGAPPVAGRLDAGRLGDALRELRDVQAPNPEGPHLTLAGGADPLLPGCDLAGPVRLLPEGGHLLPVTAPDWCAARLAEFAEGQGRRPWTPPRATPLEPATKRAIAGAFGGAAPEYDRGAVVQRLAARRLAARIAALPLPPRPRVLEIGCGTGLLGAALAPHLPDAEWVFTDLSPAMLAACRARLGRGRFLAMDGERPALAEGGFDLVCASFAFQWFADLPRALDRLTRLLASGGHLAYALPVRGSLAEWTGAHVACGLSPGTPDLPSETALPGHVTTETLLHPHPDGLAFLRSLRAIGAGTPRPGHRPLPPATLRRVLRAFEAEGAVASYRVATAVSRRPPRPGVFVAGTDTGVGKTLVAAILARAWGAEYWKPIQTGLAEEPGDTDTIAALAGCRTHPPRHALQAPLSPEAAGLLEGVRVAADAILPPGPGPIVVEGAGGVLVPLNGEELTTALIARLGLPVVLVARSTLGTLNHTLLSLEALRARGLTVAGLVLNGPPNGGNRTALERHGGMPVLAEIPPLDRVDAAAVTRLAAVMPGPPDQA